VFGIGLGEDGADRGGDHLLGAFGDLSEHVAQEVIPAPLPGRADHHRGDGGLEAGVGIGDHQLGPAQSAGLRAAQERGPEGSVLAVPDGEAWGSPRFLGRTSRRPSALTPVATTMAWDTTREPLPLRAPPTRALQ